METIHKLSKNGKHLRLALWIFLGVLGSSHALAAPGSDEERMDALIHRLHRTYDDFSRNCERLSGGSQEMEREISHIFQFSSFSVEHQLVCEYGAKPGNELNEKFKNACQEPGGLDRFEKTMSSVLQDFEQINTRFDQLWTSRQEGENNPLRTWFASAYLLTYIGESLEERCFSSDKPLVKRISKTLGDSLKQTNPYWLHEFLFQMAAKVSSFSADLNYILELGSPGFRGEPQQLKELEKTFRKIKRLVEALDALQAKATLGEARFNQKSGASGQKAIQESLCAVNENASHWTASVDQANWVENLCLELQWSKKSDNKFATSLHSMLLKMKALHAPQALMTAFFKTNIACQQREYYAHEQERFEQDLEMASFKQEVKRKQEKIKQMEEEVQRFQKEKEEHQRLEQERLANEQAELEIAFLKIKIMCKQAEADALEQELEQEKQKCLEQAEEQQRLEREKQEQKAEKLRLKRKEARQRKAERKEAELWGPTPK